MESAAQRQLGKSTKTKMLSMRVGVYPSFLSDFSSIVLEG